VSSSDRSYNKIEMDGHSALLPPSLDITPSRDGGYSIAIYSIIAYSTILVLTNVSALSLCPLFYFIFFPPLCTYGFYATTQLMPLAFLIAVRDKCWRERESSQMQNLAKTNSS